jgi:hypothetical protein
VVRSRGLAKDLGVSLFQFGDGQSAQGLHRRVGVIGRVDSPVRKASTKRTIKANRLKRFKSIDPFFLMLRTLAHASCIGVLAAHALGQKLGDDVQSLGRREVIAVDRLVRLDRPGCVRERAREVRACDGGSGPPSERWS